MFDFDSFIKSQIVLATEEVSKAIEEKALEFFDVGDKKNIINEYLKFNKLTQQHIDVYNNFIKKASNIICSKVIDIGDGRKIYFEDLKFEKPMYQHENTRRKLLPMHARRAHKNYESEWSVQVVIKQNNKEVYRSTDHIAIARIPVMLFSMLCHLEDMTDEELIEVGEDPLEYGGYFIVGGTEMIILLEEKLSTNRMFIMNSTGDVKDYNTTLKITTDTLKGTRLDELIYNVSNIMKYSLQSVTKAKDEKKKCT
jgi:DNA-directed RNA polymerase III subunit RPC2